MVVKLDAELYHGYYELLFVSEVLHTRRGCGPVLLQPTVLTLAKLYEGKNSFTRTRGRAQVFFEQLNNCRKAFSFLSSAAIVAITTYAGWTLQSVRKRWRRKKTASVRIT
jgi:hypothetical protein